MWKQSVHELFWLLTSFFPHFQVVFPKVVNLKQLSRRCCFIKHATCEYKIASKSIPFLLKGYPSIIDITDSYSCMCIYIYHIILYHIISYYIIIILYHYIITYLLYPFMLHTAVYIIYVYDYYVLHILWNVLKCIVLLRIPPQQPYTSRISPNCQTAVPVLGAASEKRRRGHHLIPCTEYGCGIGAWWFTGRQVMDWFKGTS